MSHIIEVAESFTLKDFQRNPAECINRLKQTRQPIELTVNGQAEVVMFDAQSFRQMLETIENTETLEAIKRGLEHIREGRTRPASEFFEEMREKYNIPAKQ